MFERLYRGAMRNGSRILFGLALVLLLFGIVSALRFVGRLTGENDLHPQWIEIFASLLAGFSYFVVPFVAAVATDRFDRWLGRGDGSVSGD
jgi:NO-binding membrane sensor protein with MHYT domain